MYSPASNLNFDYQTQPTNQAPCPCCGYCPRCGRSNNQPQPWSPPYTTGGTLGGYASNGLTNGSGLQGTNSQLQMACQQ